MNDGVNIMGSKDTQKILIAFSEKDMQQLQDLISWIKELIDILEKNLHDVRTP